jgi:hypothetical protein
LEDLSAAPIACAVRSKLLESSDGAVNN